MRRALSEFEQGPGYDSAPSRERAFYSALRTLLSDIGAVPDAVERDTRTRAAHKWFSKHRPRGLTEDPAIFAAMAASLSLGGVQASQQQQHQQQQISNVPRGKPFVPQGTKHEFFASYSKESPIQQQQQQRQKQVSPKAESMQALMSKPGGPSPGMPVVLQPAVPGARPTASARQLTSSLRPTAAPGAVESLEYASGASEAATVPMPRLKSRVVFDPEKMGPTGSSGVPGGAGAAGVAGGDADKGRGAAPGWFSGPFRDSGNRVSNTRETIERMTRGWVRSATLWMCTLVDRFS